MKRNKENYQKNQKIFHFFKKSLKSPTKLASEFYTAHLLNANRTAELQTESIHLNKKSDETNAFKSEIEGLKLQLNEEKMKNEVLSKANAKYKNDLTQLRKLYNEVCRTFVKKDLKIKMLERRCVSSEIIFDKYNDILGPAIIKKLRKLGDGSRSDSTFVHTCLQKLYEKDFDKLTKKSAMGSGKTELLTPTKRKIIEELFLERLTIENLDENKYMERFGKLNAHLNASIQNIRRLKVVLN